MFSSNQNSFAGTQEMAMAALSQEQINKFWDDGVLVVEGAVSAKELSDLKQVFENSVLKHCSKHCFKTFLACTW